MTVPAPAAMPWRLSDLWKVGLANAAGMIAVLVAWFGAAGSVVAESQVNWVLVGAGGIAVLGVGNCIWLLIGRRGVGLRRRIVLRPLAEWTRCAEPSSGVLVDTLVWEAERVVWAAGMSHYHRPDCQLVDGKDVVFGTIAQQDLAGRSPCGMCSP